MLAALQTWSTWLPQNIEKNNYLKELLDVSLPLLQSDDRELTKVRHAAAHLLLGLSVSAFPPLLVSFPSVVDLLQRASYLRYFNHETNKVVNRAFCNILIRPWGDLSQVDSDRRNMLIVMFFDGLCKDFKGLSYHSDVNKMKEIVNQVLPMLSNIVECCKNYPSSSKKLLYMGIKVSGAEN